MHERTRSKLREQSRHWIDWELNGSAMTALGENLERLEEAIAAACRAAGRARGEVELMAVSKTFPAETIAEAAALGLTLFGENRVQEFAGKAQRATDLGLGAVAQKRPLSSDRAFAIEQGGAGSGGF